MTSQQLREDDLISALRAIVERPSRRVRVGIGDDAAVWQPSRSNRSVITTDASIENVHFRREWMSWHEIGVRAMAPNISDIAAMGARPVLATVSLGIPADVEADALLDVYRGMTAVTDDARCTIAGGDIVRAPALSLAITVVGEVRQSRLKLRSGMRPGDVIACTGPLGASRAGLQVLRDEVQLHGAQLEEAMCAFRTPAASWREGLWLGASVNVHAMMDCSDGLSTDLDRMAQASGVGVVVEHVPVAGVARDAASELGMDPQVYALAGGEDYVLIVAVAPRSFDFVASRFRARFGRDLQRIGVADESAGLRRRVDGAEVALPRSGWDHLG